MGADNCYICVRRSDIPRGVLQVLDLEPNESQRAQVLTTPGQTKYLNRVRNEAVRTYVGSGSNVVVAADTRGLAAYLIDHVEAGGLAAGTNSLTGAEALDAAEAIIAIMDAGNPLDLAAVNAAIAGVVANSELTDGGGSESTGSLEDVLRILAGGEYLLPAGSVVSTGGTTFTAAVSGSFEAGKDRLTYRTGSFLISAAEGQLSVLKSDSFSYDGTAGAAIVIYSHVGAVV